MSVVRGPGNPGLPPQRNRGALKSDAPDGRPQKWERGPIVNNSVANVAGEQRELSHIQDNLFICDLLQQSIEELPARFDQLRLRSIDPFTVDDIEPLFVFLDELRNHFRRIFAIDIDDHEQVGIDIAKPAVRATPDIPRFGSSR